MPGVVVGDRENATPYGRSAADAADLVVWLTLDAEAVDPQDATVSQLDRLAFLMPGALRTVEGSTTEVLPLIQTSENSMQIPTSTLQGNLDPRQLLNDFQAEEAYTLVARITGKAKTAFPDGNPNKPADEEDASPAGDTEGDESADEADPEHLTESAGPINVIAISDCDVISDMLWVQRDFFGRMMPSADNGNLILNALDNLGGSSDLISIRGRGRFSRPFEVVEDIRREAEANYGLVEQELRAELDRIEGEIAQLRQDISEQRLAPSSEQIEQFQQKLDEAVEEQLKTNKRLREVLHNRSKDIDSLGSWVRWTNILIVPLVFAGASALFGLIVSSRRRG